MPIRDRDFDRVFSSRIRFLSATHWTPLFVAQKGIQFLAHDEKSRILDVGSGVGKFCIVSGIIKPNSIFGVEKRRDLVKTARNTAILFELQNVYFINENAMEIDWKEFDGVYLYNPFYEQVAHPSLHIDKEIVTSREKYSKYVTVAVEKLSSMKKGTRVVTYNGFGADMPDSFSCVWKEVISFGTLAFWVKSHRGVPAL